MSRTFRRKNYEIQNATSWDRKGRKAGGFYTEAVWNRAEGTHWSSGWYTYRPKTERERAEAYWRNHGESGTSSSNSPSAWHRQVRQRENRSINKEELIKFLKNPDTYEPMFEENPRNCWWDWS